MCRRREHSARQGHALLFKLPPDVRPHGLQPRELRFDASPHTDRQSFENDDDDDDNAETRAHGTPGLRPHRQSQRREGHLG